MRKIWVTLVLAVACGGGNTNELEPPVASGGSSASGGEGSAPDDPDANSAAGKGAAGDGSDEAGGANSGAGGAVDAAAGQTYELAGAPMLGPPGVCAPDLALDDDEAVALDVDGDVTLLSMTPDELSVAFTMESDAAFALYVADRASSDAELVATAVTLPSGYEAASGAALSADGLRLLLVMSDHSGFGELQRESRASAFAGEPDVTAYAQINALKPMSGRSVGWPVISNDGQHLYFLSYFGQGLVTLSKRGDDGVFDFGTTIDEYTLGGDEGAYKLPNGLSPDERAIFFFDEATQHAMALFRSRPEAPFYDPLDLGARRGAAPSADCARVYSSRDGVLVSQARR